MFYDCVYAATQNKGLFLRAFTVVYLYILLHAQWAESAFGSIPILISLMDCFVSAFFYDVAQQPLYSTRGETWGYGRAQQPDENNNEKRQRCLVVEYNTAQDAIDFANRLRVIMLYHYDDLFYISSIWCVSFRVVRTMRGLLYILQRRVAERWSYRRKHRRLRSSLRSSRVWIVIETRSLNEIPLFYEWNRHFTSLSCCVIKRKLASSIRKRCAAAVYFRLDGEVLLCIVSCFSAICLMTLWLDILMTLSLWRVRYWSSTKHKVCVCVCVDIYIYI